ncbi:hypothetical protein CLAFUW4_01703 [Fulvia fulva]|uniref:Uncharacterized protein n=1 Tax=Passalora fulva TaxID=5499 RepID=A0A9Q8L4U9_PASFU|nr:uncharacterized protein CLAFUR5_01700 [Fulvia fulva]KAK4635103.1 hypothetical protein CLAFUR4_01701 [Fulvia fulva]KAK4636648.1 hypothetical protein CLAFUR0_01702 [Fulvia fulva]UJO10897.1 hypothetical protein CLAFUR5_01700 [Fulvia fulva]WPV09497.1 hypothetical protein CLAFUW4_01703 [Fulvia fulva]WPV24727.1 hypothetical protein CLAFUW7_01705 [Fulvia fulva]
MAPSRALLAPRHVCTHWVQALGLRRQYSATTNLFYAEASCLPRVATPSFCSSLIPSFLRRPASKAAAVRRAEIRDAGADERRTGLIFLFLGIFVGSNAINIIGIRREMLNFTRQTDAKLELLRDVVQKVQNGEDVDVKKALGTGDPEQEKEWEQVMQELENTDMLWEGRKKRDAKRAAKAEERRLKDEEKTRAKEMAQHSPDSNNEAPKTSRPKFLM